MTYKTHFATSLSVGLPIMDATGTVGVGAIVALALGALLPDIDAPGSWIGRRTRGLSDLSGKLCGHRGITHSLVAVAFIALLTVPLILFLSLSIPVVVALVGGYFLHLAGDSFSKSGIAWLRPFSKRNYQSGFRRVYYNTGSGVEMIVLVVASLFLAWMISRMNLAALTAELEQIGGWVEYILSFGR